MPNEKREATKDWLTIVGVVLGGAWGLWNFAWEQSIKPRFFEEPHLRATISLEHPTARVESYSVDAHPVLIRVAVENPSRRTLRMLTGQLAVHGHVLLPVDQKMFTPAAVQSALERDKAVASRYWSDDPNAELLLSGSAFVGWSFSPGERHEFSRLVWVPRAKFDALEASLHVKSTTDKRLCMSPKVSAKFETDTPVGKLRDEECVLLTPESPEEKSALEDVSASDSTAYLPVAGVPKQKSK